MTEVALTGLNSLSPNLVGAVKPITGEDYSSIERECQELLPKSKVIFGSVNTPSGVSQLSVEETVSKAGLNIQDIDFVISCSQTSDFDNPGLVSVILARFRVSGIPGLEIRQLACGAIFAIDLASKLIRTGQASKILVVCTDLLSRYFPSPVLTDIPLESRYAALTFGDGASSFIVTRKDLVKNLGYEVLHSSIGGSGKGFEAFVCKLPSASKFPLRMSPRDIVEKRHYPVVDILRFKKLASKFLEEEISHHEDRAGALSACVTHGAYLNFGKELPGKLKCRIADVFDTHGFIGSAGIPMAVSELNLTSGQMALVTTVSAGFHFGSVLLRRI